MSQDEQVDVERMSQDGQEDGGTDELGWTGGCKTDELGWI